MALKAICFSVFVLSLLHQDSSEGNVCFIQSQLANGFWQHTTDTNRKPDEIVLDVPICCAGYVVDRTPECDPKCPLGHCVFGYCPPDDDNVNCYCYQDSHHPSSCIPSCQTSHDCSQQANCNTNCTCHKGFTKDVRTNLCVPNECFHRCTSGNCNEFGTCVDCDDYRKAYTDRTGICLSKICVQKCSNGFCSNNGVCVCNNGFVNVDNFTCTKISCPSEQNKDNLFCKNQSDTKCPDGKCSDDAGKCICTAKNILSLITNCILPCTPECTVENCTYSNNYICHEGVVKVNGSCKCECSLTWVGLSAMVGGILLVVAAVVGFGVFCMIKMHKKKPGTRYDDDIEMKESAEQHGSLLAEN